MSRLTDAVGAAFDQLTEATSSADQTSAAKLEATPTSEVPGNTPAADVAEPDTNEASEHITEDTETADPSIPATPQLQSKKDALVDTNDLKSIKDRFAADHPELVPVMEAFLKESERGLNKKFEKLASAIKETSQDAIVADVVKTIPKEHLAGMTYIYNVAQNGTPQQKAQVADQLFTLSENLRSQSNSNSYNPVPHSATQQYSEQEPDWAKDLRINQQMQQIQQQVDAVYDSLKSEFGGNAIPMNQREHVAEEVQRLGISDINAAVSIIPVLWRGHYGADYKAVEALKKGQKIRTEKESLGISSGVSPGASSSGGSGNTNKPKGMRNRLAAILDDAGVK